MDPSRATDIERRCLEYVSRSLESAKDGFAPLGLLDTPEMLHTRVTEVRLLGQYPDTRLEIRLTDAGGCTGVFVRWLWPGADDPHDLQYFLDELDTDIVQHATLVLRDGIWESGRRRPRS